MELGKRSLYSILVKKLIVILLSLTPLCAATFYVAPGASGEGTLESPFGLTTAFGSASIHGGDTVYLRGGTYSLGTNTTSITINGSDGNLITWRAYQNEIPVIDGWLRLGTNKRHRFWGITFMDSAKGLRGSQNPQAHIDDATSSTSENEWINCVFHDTHNCFSGTTAGASVRGCIFYYIGMTSAEHAVYPAVASFTGNIVAWTAGQAIELGADNMVIRSNIIWGAGQTINEDGRELLLASISATVDKTYIYTTRSTAVYFNDASSHTVSVTDSILSAKTPVYITGAPTLFTMTGNTIHMGYSASVNNVFERTSASGSWSINNNAYSAVSPRSVQFVNVGAAKTFAEWKSDTGFDAASTSANSSVPTDAVRVIPNQDEAKRAHIAVFNWTGADNVTVSLSGVLSQGDSYQLYSAQNYSYGPILSGTYNGTSISVPMTNLTYATPIFNATYRSMSNPTLTSPTFAAFVVKPITGTSKSGGLRLGNLKGR